jgi:hypothetical protein
MIDGIATFTIVASTMIIETPRLSMASPSQRPRPLVAIVGVEAGIAWDVIVSRAPHQPSPSTERFGHSQ